MARFRGLLGRRACWMLNALSPASLQDPHHLLHLAEGEADGRAVGAHLDARRPLVARVAEVALGGFLLQLAVRARPVGDHDDVAPRAALGAVAAADAGPGRVRVVVDGDDEGVGLAGDGPRGAVDHAHGIRTLVAGGGDEPVAVALALPHEAGHAPVSVRAAAHALVAARTGAEVDEEHALP